MDLHPILVHFPIALFTLYALLEILPLERRIGNGYFYTKFFMLLFGTVGSAFTYITGRLAGEALEHGALHDVVELHEQFATLTILFAVLALLFFAVRIALEKNETAFSRWIAPSLTPARRAMLMRFSSRPLAVALAILILFFVTITGALGGSMVYGPDADPVVKFVYQVFQLGM